MKKYIVLAGKWSEWTSWQGNLVSCSADLADKNIGRTRTRTCLAPHHGTQQLCSPIGEEETEVDPYSTLQGLTRESYIKLGEWTLIFNPP